MNQQPLVSVIIPTYSRPDNIVRAVDSVLTQTYKNIEIIVVDDNGEGTPYQIETEKVLKEYIDNGKITYIKHEVNKNGSAARNTGFRASHGEYVNFLDDDDYFMVDNIAVKVNNLRKTVDKVGASFSPVCFITQKEGDIKEIVTFYNKEGDILEDFLLGKALFNTSGILFKRDAILKLHGFNDSYKRHQDFELLIRFFKLFIMSNASAKPLYYMELNSSGIHGKMKNRFNFERNFLKNFEKELRDHSCYHSTSHFFYWQSCLSLLESRQYFCFFKSLSYSLIHGCFSLGELKALLSAFIKGIRQQ